MKDMIQPPPQLDPSSHPGMPPQQPVNPLGTGGGGIDLIRIKQYLHVIVRRIWIVAICFVIALVMSVMQVSKQESVFRSSTALLLTRGTQLPGVSAASAAENNFFGDFLDTQLRIMNSAAVINRARESMNMAEDKIRQLSRGVSVWAIGKSSVVVIQVDSLDSKFSADYANQMANAYMAFKEDERLSRSQTTSINLMQQANKIRDELRKAEEALITFKKDNSLVVTEVHANHAAKIMSDLSQRTATHRM